MNPDNPVISLCVHGMQAEAEHRFEDARALFTQAWEARQNDYDACVAAHFLARQQDSPQDMLRWNEAALHHADAVEGDGARDSVREFYPSLYLNLGACHEALGHQEEALRCYELAAERLADLPAGSYGDVMRDAVARGLARIGAEVSAHAPQLILNRQSAIMARNHE